MNWDAIGAVGEIIGALAVIATLGYLAVQIRENARSTTTSIYESAMDGYIELNRSMLEADIGAVYFKSLKDPESLSEFEQFRFNNLHRMWLAHVYKLFRLYERGVLPKDEWDDLDRSHPGVVQALWLVLPTPVGSLGMTVSL